MRISVMCLSGLLALAVTAQAEPEQKAKAAEPPASKFDTVNVTVDQGVGNNQVRLDIFVVNAEAVAGMPMPLKVSTKDAKLKFDSISYVGGRVEYFQLKTQNADTVNQTLLVGLIADLSGTKPPLAPGRGKAFSLFYSSAKPLAPGVVMVEPVVLSPANRLEFNTLEADGSVGSTIPTFVSGKAKPVDKKP